MQIKINKLLLVRSYLDNGTFGTIYHPKYHEEVCKTVELPWLSNEPYISCIPPGEYELKPFSSNSHPNCFSLENEHLGVSVYGNTPRTGILIHIANFVSDIEGCIGPGMALHPKTWGVSNSRIAMDKLRRMINFDNGEKWILEIK